MYTKKILITSPSLNVKDNVSGISSLVGDILNYSNFKFVHFKLGSKDGIKKDLMWALNQLVIYIKIIYTSIFRRYEIVHLNVGLEKFSIIRDSIIFFLEKHIFNKKVILHIHGGFFLMNEPKSKMLCFLLNKIFKNAEVVIVLSEMEKEVLSKRYGNLSFYVFPNAVDTDYVSTISNKTSNERIKFIFMGRINETKGIYTISDSLQYLKKYFDRFTLEIYGAGPELHRWINTLNAIEGFRYTYNGVVGGKDKWKALGNADVFLLPSLHSEGMPIAMIEAMAAGCVVIVTDVASVSSIVHDNVNGILLSESCPKQLARKMEDIIEGRYNLNSMGQKAKEYVQANLSVSNYISKLDHLYATL